MQCITYVNFHPLKNNTKYIGTYLYSIHFTYQSVYIQTDADFLFFSFLKIQNQFYNNINNVCTNTLYQLEQDINYT